MIRGEVFDTAYADLAGLRRPSGFLAGHRLALPGAVLLALRLPAREAHRRSVLPAHPNPFHANRRRAVARAPRSWACRNGVRSSVGPLVGPERAQDVRRRGYA